MVEQPASTSVYSPKFVLTTAWHLKQVVDFKLLKNAALQLDKIIGDHDGEKSFAVGVHGYRECGGLNQDDVGMND